MFSIWRFPGATEFQWLLKQRPGRNVFASRAGTNATTGMFLTDWALAEGHQR